MGNIPTRHLGSTIRLTTSVMESARADRTARSKALLATLRQCDEELSAFLAP